MRVVEMLSNQSDAALSVVRVELRYIQVINKVDELELPWRSVGFASLLLNWLFQLGLQECGVRVKVHVYRAAREAVGVQLGNSSFDELSLPAARSSDQKDVSV